jgi:hypothetical protein
MATEDWGYMTTHSIIFIHKTASVGNKGKMILALARTTESIIHAFRTFFALNACS